MLASGSVAFSNGYSSTTCCPHVTAVGQIEPDEIVSKKQEPCGVCHFTGASRWLCINENCFFVGCGERRKNHAAQHAHGTRHHLQINLRTYRMWCHDCQVEVKPLLNSPPWPAGNALLQSLPSKQSSAAQKQKKGETQLEAKNGMVNPHYGDGPAGQQVLSVEHHSAGDQANHDARKPRQLANSVGKEDAQGSRGSAKSASSARHLVVPAPGPKLISVADDETERRSVVSSGSTVSTAVTVTHDESSQAEKAQEPVTEMEDVRVRQFFMPGRPYIDRERPTAVVDSPLDFASASREDEPIGLTGLRNLGNTCYMNSALQALSNSVPLTEYLLNCRPVALAERPGQRCLASEYGALVSELWNERRPPFLVPYNVLSWVRMCHPSFRGYQQQDAQEFLRFFLDQLHEDLKQPVYAWECQGEMDQSTSVTGRIIRGRESRDSRDENGDSTSTSVSTSSGVGNGQSDDGAYRTCDSGWLSDHEVTKRSNVDGRGQASSPKRKRTALSESFIDDAGESGGQRSFKNVSTSGNHRRPQSANAGDDSSDFSDAKQELSPLSPKRTACLPKRKALRYGSGVPRKKPVRYRSIVSDVFDGKLLSSVQCLTCNTVSETRETFQDLSIPIPGRDQIEALRNRAAAAAASQVNSGTEGVDSQKKQQLNDWWNWFVSWFSWLGSWMSSPAVTLEDCLAAFFSADDLKGDDMYSCDGCKKLRNGVKCCYLLQLPEVLCIHLKRFRHELMYSTKISTRVTFPLDGLDLRPFLHRNSAAVNGEHTYDLYAVVCHHGTVESGHYTAYCLNSLNGRWYEYDDQCVTEVDPYVVQSAASAYILFYRKRGERQQKIREETAALLQRSNSVLPQFFISQEWINRFNYMSDPGPITNFDFLCPHGCIDPKKHDFLPDLYAEVPAVAWQYLYKKFGGGPVCNKLLHCIDCNQYYRRLKGRRDEELQTFYRIERAYKQDNRAECFYALSMKWFRKWEAFVLNRQEEPPGPIDNTDIAAKKTEKNENVRVRPGADYISVHRELWEFFYDRYGGGPEILMTSISAMGYSNRNRQQEALASGH